MDFTFVECQRAVNPGDRVPRTATSVNYIGKFERKFPIPLITVKKTSSDGAKLEASHVPPRISNVKMTETVKLSFELHLLVFDATFKI